MKSMFFSPESLVAAMRGGAPAAAPVQAPIVQSAPPTSSGIPAELNVISDTPGASAYADRLIAAGMRPNQTGSPWEGVGSLAQLASGYYGKMKDDDRQKERDNALADYISKHNPELAPLFAAGDAQSRSRMVGDMISSQGDKRKEEAARRKTAELGEAMKAAMNPDGTVDNQKLIEAALRSGNQKLIDTVTDNLTKKTNERDSAAHRVRVMADALSPGGSFEALKKSDPDKAAQVWQQASGLEAKIPPEMMPGANQPGKHFDGYESARDLTERRELLAASRRRHEKNDADIQSNFAAAQRGNQALMVVEGVLANAGYTGFGGNAVTALKKIGAAIGIDVEKTANNELIAAVSNELAKGARAGYPGSVSNFEMQTYLRSVVSNENTPEANKKIMEFLRLNMGEQIARAQDADEWRALRIKEGKPAILAEGFESFYRERAAQRKAEFEKRRDELRAEKGLNDRGEMQSREEKLEMQRKRSSAAGPAPAGTEATAEAAPSRQQAGEPIVRYGRDANGDTIKYQLDGGAWKEVSRQAADGRPVPGGMTNEGGRLKPNQQMLRDQMKW